MSKIRKSVDGVEIDIVRAHFDQLKTIPNWGNIVDEMIDLLDEITPDNPKFGSAVEMSMRLNQMKSGLDHISQVIQTRGMQESGEIE